MTTNLTPNKNNLTDEERSTLWGRICSNALTQHGPSTQIIKARYMNFLTSPMRKGALALLAIAVLAGTANAANAAKPGDMLFKLDLSLEKMRLTFADADTKMDLRIKFAEERVTELEEILAEDVADESTTEDAAPGTANGAPDVAPNTTNADIALAQSIEHLELAKLAIEENGGSEIALTALNAIIEKLNARIGALPEGTNLKIAIDNDRDETEIRIRLKGSEKNEDDDDADEHENEIKIDNETRIGLNDDEKIEVRVEGDVAKIEVEIGNMHDKFQLPTTNQSEIIAQIAVRLSMDEDAVVAILKLEIEDSDEEEHGDEDLSKPEDEDDDKKNEDKDDSDGHKEDKAGDLDDTDFDDKDDNHNLRIEAKLENNGIAEIKVRFASVEDEFEAPAETREDVIVILAARYDFTQDELDSALDLKLEN